MVLMLSTAAQQVLVLEKIGRGKYVTYKEGDVIQLRTITGDFRIREKIFRITDSSVVVGGNYPILYTDIAYIERSFRSRKRNGTNMMIAGGVLVLITSVNNILHNNVVVDPLFLSIGAGLVVTGGVWYSLWKRKFPVGSKWKLKVLDPYF